MAASKSIPKRSYRKPEFQVYGDVRRLTQDVVSGATQVDADISGNKKTV